MLESCIYVVFCFFLEFPPFKIKHQILFLQMVRQLQVFSKMHHFCNCLRHIYSANYRIQEQRLDINNAFYLYLQCINIHKYKIGFFSHTKMSKVCPKLRQIISRTNCGRELRGQRDKFSKMVQDFQCQVLNIKTSNSSTMKLSTQESSISNAKKKHTVDLCTQ